MADGPEAIKPMAANSQVKVKMNKAMIPEAPSQPSKPASVRKPTIMATPISVVT